MKKYFWFILLFIFLFLFGCSTGNGVNGNDSEISNSEDLIKDNNVENNEGRVESENDEEREEKNLIKAAGIYNGQADPHTIEIETDDGPLAFQLTMEAREDVEHLSVNDKVTYSYTEDGNSREIQSIESSGEKNHHEVKTETGIYNGQADPHTIEIETGDGPLAFQLTMEAREDVEQLTVDDEVTYSYISEGESREIQSIKQAKDGNSKVMKETGIYNGQADPHTIEIETDDGPLAFQLTMEAREDVEHLSVNDKVTYSYTEDGNNREIQSIKKSE